MKRRKTFKHASRYNLLYNRISDESMPWEARWLYTILDSFADKDGKPRYKPPVSKILQRAGMGRTLFYKLRGLLVDAGWIKPVPRVGPNGHLSTEYHIEQDWSGVLNKPVPHVPQDDTTPVRVAAPLDMALLRIRVEEERRSA